MVWHNSLQLMRGFLKNHKKQGNVNSCFSKWERNFTGVSQGAILAPVLLNNFLNDLFLIVTHAHLSICADGTKYLVLLC